MGVRFDQACWDCRSPSRVHLGEITFTTAQDLARALRPAAPPCLLP